jgi:branched-subunit amino acid aminotransferase/4-amino-4-deoxychorismate lyase
MLSRISDIATRTQSAGPKVSEGAAAMSSTFDLHEHVRRLRTTFSYFKNASSLTGEELQRAQHMLRDERARAEWFGLIAEIRDLLLALEGLAPEPSEPQYIEIARPSTVNLDSIYDYIRTTKALH